MDLRYRHPLKFRGYIAVVDFAPFPRLWPNTAAPNYIARGQMAVHHTSRLHFAFSVFKLFDFRILKTFIPTC